MRREEGGVGLIFGGGVAAEGFGHYFCFSKEESAIAQFIPDIFQIGISHIIHTKHKTMLITIERFAHIGKEFERKLLSFLIDFGEMNDARALGFRHFDYVLWWWWLGERKGGVAEER